MLLRFLFITLFLTVGVCTSSTFAISAPQPSSAQQVLGSDVPSENFFAGTTKADQKALRKAMRAERKAAKRSDGGRERSWAIALVLSILLGGLGIDRFYLGRIPGGILKLLTLGGLGIWYLIDIILIATRALKPLKGSYTD